MNKKVIILLLYVLLISSCASFLALFDDKITLIRQNYTGNQLRIDGFYYNENESYEGIIYDFYALYKNGIILNIGGSTDSNLYQRNSNKFLLKDKDSWGVFQVSRDSIKFERWYPGEVSKTYVRSGKILNDTTFIIMESYRLKYGTRIEKTKENEIYHFKAFSPKPDSTNSFIK